MLQELPHHSRDRARRYAARTNVRYREAGHDGDWHDGRTENISRTGVLIRTRHLIAAQTPIEIQLTLPPQLGGPGGTVIGRGRVVRAEPPTGVDTNATVAAFIAECMATDVADHDPRRI